MDATNQIIRHEPPQLLPVVYIGSHLHLLFACSHQLKVFCGYPHFKIDTSSVNTIFLWNMKLLQLIITDNEVIAKFWLQKSVRASARLSVFLLNTSLHSATSLTSSMKAKGQTWIRLFKNIQHIYIWHGFIHEAFSVSFVFTVFFQLPLKRVNLPQKQLGVSITWIKYWFNQILAQPAMNLSQNFCFRARFKQYWKYAGSLD